jgi:hypothetical protein
MACLLLFRRSVKSFGDRRLDEAFQGFGPIPPGVPSLLMGLALGWIGMACLWYLRAVAGR